MFSDEEQFPSIPSQHSQTLRTSAKADVVYSCKARNRAGFSSEKKSIIEIIEPGIYTLLSV